MENLALQQIEQCRLNALPWTKRILQVLRDPETGRLKPEVRPRDLPKILNISIQKAATELPKIHEYARVVLNHGGVKYVAIE